MADPDPYLRFTRYNAWANRRVGTMLEALSGAQRPLRLFSHLLRAERVWLGRIQGTEDVALPIWETDTLSVCRGRVEANAAAFEDLAASLAPADLSKIVTYTTSQGAEYRTPVGDILSHVFNHSTHHRRQIVLLVREAGQVPAPLDLIAHLRSVP